MPYRVTFELDAFNGTRDASESHQDLGAMLDCLVTINTNFLVRRVGYGDRGQNPAVPLLYASRVWYEEEPIGSEFWRDIPTILRYAREGGGSDCEDLVCWQVAELRVRFGIPARPYVLPQWQEKEQSFLYHIQTWTPSGIDDPSALLGMNGASRPACLPGQPNCAGMMPRRPSVQIVSTRQPPLVRRPSISLMCRPSMPLMMRPPSMLLMQP